MPYCVNFTFFIAWFYSSNSVDMYLTRAAFEHDHGCGWERNHVLRVTDVYGIPEYKFKWTNIWLRRDWTLLATEQPMEA